MQLQLHCPDGGLFLGLAVCKWTWSTAQIKVSIRMKQAGILHMHTHVAVRLLASGKEFLGFMRKPWIFFQIAVKKKLKPYYNYCKCLISYKDSTCLIWEYPRKLGYGRIMDERQLNSLTETLHYTHSLAIGFIQWTLLLDLGQLHVNLLADHCHGIPSWTSTRHIDRDRWSMMTQH